MENLYYGIFTLIICTAGYFFSWRFFLYNRMVIAVLLLMICGLILRIYFASDFYLHAWDERYHALVAKNLISHPLLPALYDNPVLPFDYHNWTSNHIWLHKQPLPLWMMALSMGVFGPNEIAVRLPSILLTTLGIWLTFRIGQSLANVKVGFIAAFLYSIHGLIIEFSGGRMATDHIDASYLFFIELAVFFALKFSLNNKNQACNIFCGMSIGAAILCKWLPALIVIPIWYLFIIGSKKFTIAQILMNLLILCFVILVTVMPWQLYIHYEFPLESQWESHYNLRHITEVLDKQGGPFYYYFDNLRIVFGELIYIPLIWFLYKTFTDLKNYNRLALAVWLFVPIIFFSIVQTKMIGYIIFTAPAIFIITGIFCQYLYRYRYKYTWLIYTIILLLLALPVRYCIERVSFFEIRERRHQWAIDLKALKKNIHDERKTVIFNTAHPIEAMFYTGATAYPEIPEINVLGELRKKGFNIIVLDKGDLNNDVRKLADIQILKVSREIAK
ncbi:MAG: glycosyltransferase family 39 protein [Bacteroidetes bacterium]|nr:glycosyltransferase family 39 protein [Bacteroidota bacterium]